MRKITAAFLFVGSFLCFLPAAHAINLTLTQTPGGPGKNYTLSWTAAVKSTDTSRVTYYVFEEFGSDAIGFDTVAPTAHANYVTSRTEELSVVIGSHVGSRGFIVTSEDDFDGATYVSNAAYHSFVHVDQDNLGAAITRTDGDGTNRGVSQVWKFGFKMDDDALVSMKIYGPGTVFATDAQGFVTTAATPVKTLLDSVPRSGELGSGSIFATNNDDVWDCRSSSGVIVPNGIYYVLVQSNLDSGHQAFSEGALRYGARFSIPVDIIRIINVNATAITISNPTSVISYSLTGDSNVRVLIAQPGSSLTVDSNGDVQPVNRTTGLIDTTLIVSTKTFQRKAGSNSESWDGTSSTGTVMPAGVYIVGLSARDDYGNHAVDSSGNDFPIFTTITLERTVGSNTGGTTASDSTPPTISSINPGDGSSINTPVSSVVFVLADSESTLNLSGTSFVIRDPSNAVVPNTLSNNGADTVTATFSTPLTRSGTYTMTITALDNAGNSATFTRTFTLNIRLESTALEGSLSIFPNPAKNTTANIRYDVSVDSSVDLDIFNVRGEKVYSTTASATQGTNQLAWNLRNTSGSKVGSGLYLLRIKANGGGSNAEAIKKIVVVQ